MTQTPTLPLAATPAVLPDAGVMARFRERARQRAGEQDLLVVCIGRERFGMPLDAVEELVEAPRPRAVPGGPAALIGVFPHGNALLPFFDPAVLLGVASPAAPVALVMRGGQRRIALAVDDADDVVRVTLANLRDAPRSERHDDLVVGLLWHERELLTVIDARGLIASCGSIFPEAR